MNCGEKRRSGVNELSCLESVCYMQSGLAVLHSIVDADRLSYCKSVTLLLALVYLVFFLDQLNNSMNCYNSALFREY